MTYTPFDILSGNQRCHMRTATFAHNEYQIHSKRSESFNRSGVLEDLIKQMACRFPIISHLFDNFIWLMNHYLFYSDYINYSLYRMATYYECKPELLRVGGKKRQMDPQLILDQLISSLLVGACISTLQLPFNRINCILCMGAVPTVGSISFNSK
uniref:Bm10903, isoform b n=1 Tax=Brugia malayi TaxID=6279 RepID=A0A1I9G4U2_BRUMA|nr:Bm10903, isoform b [Brugia malayi]